MSGYKTPAYAVAGIVGIAGFAFGLMAGSAAESDQQQPARATHVVVYETSTDHTTATSTVHTTETATRVRSTTLTKVDTVKTTRTVTEPLVIPTVVTSTVDAYQGCNVTGDAVAMAWRLFDTGDFTGDMVVSLGQEDSAMVDEILWEREQTESGGKFDMRGLLCAHPEWITETADERGVQR